MDMDVQDVKDFVSVESVQDLIEYALVLALVGLGSVFALRMLSTKIGTIFTSIGTTLTTNV